MRRVARIAALAIVLVLASASPAVAHTLSGAPPTNYRGEVVSIGPDAEGITFRLRSLGRQVELRNDTESDVVVLGYVGEPYLRIGPDGVFENLRSPTTYLNRPGAPSPPEGATATADPKWERMSDGSTARWRDRRTRWEGADAPQVTAKPDEVHVVVPSWVIQLEHDGDAISVRGRIVYFPPPSAAPWMVLALLLGAATVWLGWSERWPALLSGALAILVAVDIVHSAGLAAFDADGMGQVLVRLLGRNTVAPVVWGLAAWAVAGIQRRDDRAVLVAVGVGIVVALIGGFSDFTSLTRSELPFAYAPSAARAAVALSLGLGLGIVGAAIVALRQHLPVTPPPPPARGTARPRPKRR